MTGKEKRQAERLKWAMLLFTVVMLLAMMAPGKAWAEEAKRLSIAAEDRSLTAGDKAVPIGAKVTAGAVVAYTSSDTDVVTVSKRGKVTALKAGAAKITIKARKDGCKTVKKAITVTVRKARQAIKVSGKSMTLHVGGTKRVQASAATKLKYTSSDTSVVTVDKDGVLTAKKAGAAVVTVKAVGTDVYKAAKTMVKVTVKKPRVKAVAEPARKENQAIYAAIPDLGVEYSVGGDDIKYGASCSKFVYVYYAYCVKGWGDVAASYGGYSATIEECAKRVLKDSDNYAAHAIHDYIRSDEARWKAYLSWLKKALGGNDVPVVSDGYKYRLGYNNSDAFCPFTTAKENSTLWQYVYRNGFNKTGSRYRNFFKWASGGGRTGGGNAYSGYTKSGWWDSNTAEYTARTCGGFYIVELADGKEHAVFLTILRDKTCWGDGILYGPDAADVALDYVVYLGNKELEKQGKLKS